MPDNLITTEDGSPAQVSPELQAQILAAAAQQQQPAAQLTNPNQATQIQREDGSPVSPQEAAGVRKAAGLVDPMLDMDVPSLVELARQTAKLPADQKFNILNSFEARQEELSKDSATVQRIADAWKAYKDSTGMGDLPNPKELAENIGGFIGGLANSVHTYLWNAAQRPFWAGTSAEPEITRNLAEATSASRVALQGIANKAQQLFSNGPQPEDLPAAVAHFTSHIPGLGGLSKTIADAAPAKVNTTPQQNVQSLFGDVERANQTKEILKGQGPLGLPQETQDALQQAGVPVRPEQVEKMAAGDILSTWLFGKAFGAVNDALPTVLSSADLAALGNATAAAAGAAVGAVAKPAAAIAGGAARVLPSAGKVLGVASAAKRFMQGEVLSAKAAYDVAVGGAKGAAKTLRDFSSPEDVLSIGRQIAGAEPAASGFAQLAKDTFQAAPAAAYEVGKGAAFDLGFAGASETPEEMKSVGLGTAFGLFGGAARMGGHALGGQIINDRGYGAPRFVPPNDVFPSLSKVDASAAAPPDVQQRLNVLRPLLRTLAGPNSELIYSPRPEASAVDPLEAALLQITGPDGKPAVSPETARNWASMGNVTAHDVGGKKLILVRDIESAPHEVLGHALEYALGESTMKQVDQLIQNDPKFQGGVFDALAQRYAQRAGWDPNSGISWQDHDLAISGWGARAAKEKIAQQDIGEGYYTKEHADQSWKAHQDQTGETWQDVLTPAEKDELARTYASRELFAEHMDAAFKHTKDFSENPTLTSKLVNVVGRFFRALGGDPLAGRTSEVGGVPLSFDVVQRGSELARQELGGKPMIEPSKSGKPAQGYGGAPVTPGDQAKAAAEAQAHADSAPNTPAVPGGRPMNEILGKIARLIASRGSGKMNYSEAPGQPGGSIWSGKAARKAALDFYRNAPEEQRALWEKTFVPERVIKTGEGKYQVLAHSPEVLFSNAQKTGATLASLIAKNPEYRSLLPAGLDVDANNFTPESWQKINDYLRTATTNYGAGRTAGGTEMVVPQFSVEGGMYKPALGEKAGTLPPDVEGFVSSLFGVDLPKTARSAKRLPLNIAGQDIRAGTLGVKAGVMPEVGPRYAPGQPWMEPGHEYPIRETNPWRGQLDAAAAKEGLSVERIPAIQKLNLERIKDVAPAPEQTPLRGNTAAIVAGFNPPEESAQFQAKTQSGRDLEKAGFSFSELYPAGGHYIRIERGGRFVGEIEASPADENTEHVASVRVSKSYQKRGIGETLYRELAARLQQEGITTLTGDVIHPAPLKIREKLFGPVGQRGADVETGLGGSMKLAVSPIDESAQFNSPPEVDAAQDPRAIRAPLDTTNEKLGFFPIGYADKTVVPVLNTPEAQALQKSGEARLVYHGEPIARNLFAFGPKGEDLGSAFSQRVGPGKSRIYTSRAQDPALEATLRAELESQNVKDGFTPVTQQEPTAQFMHSLEGIKKMNEEEIGRRERQAETETSRLSSYAGDVRKGLVLHSAKLRSTAFISPEDSKDFLAQYKATKGEREKSDLIESYFGGPTAQYSPSTDPRAIRTPAVRDEETGKTFEGAAHFIARADATRLGYPGRDQMRLVDGFLTNNGEFLDRKKAFARASELKQIAEQPGVRGLASEDLPKLTPEIQELVDSVHNTTPEEWSALVRSPKNVAASGYAHSAGMKARFPADLQLLRSTHSAVSQLGRDALDIGKPFEALHLSSKSQALREAYEAATGRTMDGTKDVSSIIRELHDKNYQPPLPAKDTSAQMNPPEENRDLRKDPRAIRSAAIRQEDTGRIFTGKYHQDAIDAAKRAKVNLWAGGLVTNGWVTNEGEFLTRKEAAQRAEEYGQVTPGRVYPSEGLHSGDMDLQFNPPGAREVDEEPKTFLVRHGSTSMNSADAAKDKIRGWANPPLSEAGKKESAAAAEQLKAAGISTVVTSDLKRARQTADTIAETTGAKVVEDPRFRPWHLGPSIEGRSTAEMLPVIQNYVDDPDKAPPRGESFNTFKNRFLEGFHAAQDKYPNENTALVTHYRGEKLMQAWRATGTDNDAVDNGLFSEFDSKIKPGGITAVDKTGAITGESAPAQFMAKAGNQAIEDAKEEHAKPLAGRRTPKVEGLLPHALPAGAIPLIHYSQQPDLTTLNPEKMGTGKATAHDARGGPKSFFFVKGSPLGADQPLFQKSHAYSASVDGSKLYDASKDSNDPLGFFGVNRLEAEAKIKRAGYSGVYVDTADGRRVVAMFKPTGVSGIGRVDETGYTALGPVEKIPGTGELAYRVKGKTYPESELRKGLQYYISPVDALVKKGILTPEDWKTNEGYPVEDGFVDPSGNFIPRNEAYRPAQGPSAQFLPDHRTIGTTDDDLSVQGRPYPKGEYSPFADPEFDTELEKIRSGKSGGQTFTTKGGIRPPPKSPKDYVSLASVNVPLGQLTRQKVEEFSAPYADLLDEPNINLGTFAFSKDGMPMASIDINSEVPQAHRKNTAAFAKDNDQVAIWDAHKNELVNTGGKGNTRLTSLGEVADAHDLLQAGEPVDVPEIQRQNRESEPAAEQQELLGGRQALGTAEMGRMTKADLAKHFPEAIIPRRRKEPISSNILESPLAKASGSPEKAVGSFARKLVEFAKEYQDHPSFQSGTRWYSEFVPKLKAVFGKDRQLMAELLAGTSPQQPPKANYAMALDALEGYKAGKFNKQISGFERGLDKLKDGSWRGWIAKEIAADKVENAPRTPTAETFLNHWIAKNNLKPRQSNGKLYAISSDAVLKILARKWLENTAGLKTQNFVQNLLGTGHGATIDLWADRTMRRIGYAGSKERWRILPKNATGVSDADFKFSQAAFREAAKQMGMTPDALQGGLWFAEKQLWADKGWGRLDLGDFRKEIAKTGLLKAGVQQRTAAQTKAAKVKPQEQLGLDIVEQK